MDVLFKKYISAREEGRNGPLTGPYYNVFLPLEIKILGTKEEAGGGLRERKRERS